MKKARNTTSAGRRRFPFDADPALADEIEAFRYQRRISTSAAAVRRLVELGVEASKQAAAPPSLPAAAPGISAITPPPLPLPDLGTAPHIRTTAPQPYTSFAVRLGKKPDPKIVWPGEDEFKIVGHKAFNHNITNATHKQLSWISGLYNCPLKKIAQICIDEFLDRELSLLNLKRVNITEES